MFTRRLTSFSQARSVEIAFVSLAVEGLVNGLISIKLIRFLGMLEISESRVTKNVIKLLSNSTIARKTDVEWPKSVEYRYSAYLAKKQLAKALLAQGNN